MGLLTNHVRVVLGCRSALFRHYAIPSAFSDDWAVCWFSCETIPVTAHCVVYFDAWAGGCAFQRLKYNTTINRSVNQFVSGFLPDFLTLRLPKQLASVLSGALRPPEVYDLRWPG